VVTLNGGQSNDPDGDSLTFQWQQTGGTPVSLSDATSAVAQFTSPTVTSDTMLQFRLTVTDPSNLSDAASTTVTVTGPSSGGGSISGLFILLGLAAVVRLGRRTYRKDVA
jgi:MYXO-CTERM domain-containing protein